MSTTKTPATPPSIWIDVNDIASISEPTQVDPDYIEYVPKAELDAVWERIVETAKVLEEAARGRHKQCLIQSTAFEECDSSPCATARAALEAARKEKSEEEHNV